MRLKKGALDFGSLDPFRGLKSFYFKPDATSILSDIQRDTLQKKTQNAYLGAFRRNQKKILKSEKRLMYYGFTDSGEESSPRGSIDGASTNAMPAPTPPSKPNKTECLKPEE